MLCFFLGGKHHHPQGETMACFTFFSQQQIDQKFHHYHSQHVGPVIRTWVHFSPEQPNNETPDKWGPPANKGETDPWKGDLPPLVWRFLCTVTSWWMTSQPTCPQTLTYLSQKQGFIRPCRKPPVKKPSIRLAISTGLVRYICVFQKKVVSPLPIAPRGGFDKKNVKSQEAHFSSYCGKNPRWNQRRVAWSARKFHRGSGFLVSLHETTVKVVFFKASLFKGSI